MAEWSTVVEIRRSNLRILTERYGSDVVTQRLDMTRQALSQCIGVRPTLKVGDKLARRIEEELQLTHGWVDQPHPGGDALSNWLIEIVRDYPEEYKIEDLQALIAIAQQIKDARVRAIRTDGGTPEKKKKPNNPKRSGENNPDGDARSPSLQER